MNRYQITWDFLREFFNYEFYEGAVKRAKQSIANEDSYKVNWSIIRDAIQNHAYESGQPLSLVNEAANQVLDENSDTEAYVWLDKMRKNIERVDDLIEKY